MMKADKEHAREFFKDIQEYIRAINDNRKMASRIDYIGIKLNIIDKGLTYQQKEKIFVSRGQNYSHSCYCYKLGEACKLHGLKYGLTEVNYEIQPLS